MDILLVLSQNHSTWLRYVISFGCNPEIAEDYVQEMYLKIYDYHQRKENNLMYNDKEVNGYFVYVVLHNMYLDDVKKSSKSKKVQLPAEIEYTEENYIEDCFDEKKAMKDKWCKELEDEIKNTKDKGQYRASLSYINFIFQKIFVEQMSITKLSQEVNLSYWSIRNTVTRIKSQIKQKKL